MITDADSLLRLRAALGAYLHIRGMCSAGLGSPNRAVPASLADRLTEVLDIVSGNSLSPGDLSLLRGRAAALCNAFASDEILGMSTVQTEAAPLTEAEASADAMFVRGMIGGGPQVCFEKDGGRVPYLEYAKFTRSRNDSLQEPGILLNSPLQKVQSSPEYRMICARLGITKTLDHYSEDYRSKNSDPKVVNAYVLAVWAVFCAMLPYSRAEDGSLVIGSQRPPAAGPLPVSAVICHQGVLPGDGVSFVLPDGVLVCTVKDDNRFYAVPVVCAHLETRPGTVAVESDDDSLGDIASAFGHGCVRMTADEIRSGFAAGRIRRRDA